MGTWACLNVCPQPSGCRAYISGKALMPMLQLLPVNQYFAFVKQLHVNGISFCKQYVTMCNTFLGMVTDTCFYPDINDTLKHCPTLMRTGQE